MIENVKCPTCDGPMASRKSVHGVFWGCKSYPKCKGTRNVDGEAKKPNPFEYPGDISPGGDDLSPSDRQRDNDRSRWRHQ